MYNFQKSVNKCYRFGSKFFIHLFLLASNIFQIKGNSNITEFASQTFSYDVLTNSTPQTTESYVLNSIETQIKEFFNVHSSNKTLDNLIKNVFNTENPNPMYIFVLPGEKNRTLVLNRNSFDKAIYPNISVGQRFLKDDPHSNKLLQLFDTTMNNKKLKDKDTEVDNFISNSKDLDESESMRIVAENVRTERNFIEFMEQLNRNGNVDENSLQTNMALKNPVDFSTYKPVNKEYEDLVSPKLKYKFEIDYSSDLLKPTTQNSKLLDWKDLGLDGWIGGLREPGKDFDTIVTE